MGEKRIELNYMRKIIGKKLKESLETIPHVAAMLRVDMTELLALSDELRSQGRKITMTALFVKALSIALTEIPELNARLEGEEAIYYDHVNPGIAVPIKNGLIVVVLRNTNAKSLFEIDADFRALMQKVREKKLTMDDMAGGTVTFSNMSKKKMEIATSIINNNEALLVTLGSIHKNAVVMPDGTVSARDMAYVIANLNHTLVDGMDGSRYLERMQQILESPKEYLL
jgi:pyruvate/2-oxoglutarate dehydrogenase complex dihydrolipoamide acyltransferase (E2) component